MSDLISKGKLLNKIATECHYDTENPLKAYTNLLNAINDAETVDVEDAHRNPEDTYREDFGGEKK